MAEPGEISPVVAGVLAGLPGWILALALYIFGRGDQAREKRADRKEHFLAVEVEASVAREGEERKTAELLLEQTNALMDQMRSWIALQAAEIERLREELEDAQARISELLLSVRGDSYAPNVP